VFGTLFIWAPAFVAVVVVVMIVAVWELAQALAQRGVTVPVVPVMLGTALMIVGGYIGGPGPLMVGLSLTASAVAVWRLSEHRPGYGRDVVAGIFTAVYIPFMAGFAALMLRDSDDGAWQVFALLAVVVASDTGGFFAGSAIGKHPLAPTVSPKKSWEGLVGSVVLALAVGVLLAAVVFDGPLWAGLLLGAVGVVGGTVGDLGESLIKRDVGVKDMSHLLPGHGGLMDRLDSLLPTAPLLWLVFTHAF
jgi:phosphatidate cytidylyltransferase